MKVHALRSGDVFMNPQYENGRSTVIAIEDHLVFRGLKLVIWHLNWEKGEHQWSFDALSPLQEIPFAAVPLTIEPETTEYEEDSWSDMKQLDEELRSLDLPRVGDLYNMRGMRFEVVMVEWDEMEGQINIVLKKYLSVMKEESKISGSIGSYVPEVSRED